MSGILGIWNLDGQPLEPSQLAALSSALAPRGGDAAGAWIDGPIGLACQLLRVTAESAHEVQPLADSAGNVIVFDGRIDNRDELLSRLSRISPVSAAAPDPALLLAAYELLEERLPEAVAGDFAFALWNSRTRRLLLARDAVGLRPLYYLRSDKLFLFASEIKAILAHSAVTARPDADALAGLVLGHCQSPHSTCFAGISSLPPSHAAVVTPEGVELQQYWDFPSGHELRYGSYAEYVEVFRRLMENAVRRRLRSAHPVAIACSGGLDSSSIFCLGQTIRHSHPDTIPPLAGVSLTYAPGTPTDEQHYLDLIERQYSVPIQRLPIGTPGMFHDLPEAVRAVETPFVDPQLNSTLAFFEAARKAGARVLLQGTWGDQVLFSQAYLVDLARVLKFSQVRRHLQEYRRWLTDSEPGTFSRQFFIDLRRSLIPKPLLPLARDLRDALRGGPPGPEHYTPDFRERFRRCLDHYPLPRGPFSSVQARWLHEMIRSMYEVGYMEWLNKVGHRFQFEAAFPFLDRDLLAFLIAIPGEILTKDGRFKTLLRDAMEGILPAEIVHRRWKADFAPVVSEGIRRDFSRLTPLLKGGISVRSGYVDGKQLDSLLESLGEHLTELSYGQSRECARLVGLELWQRVFLGEGAELPADVAAAMPRPA